MITTLSVLPTHSRDLDWNSKMNITEHSSASQGAEGRRQYIEDLLVKYPATSGQEEREILIFLTSASALDAALLTCNESIVENLNAFKQDHSKQLGFTLRNWINLAGLLAAVALAVYFLSNIGV